MENKEVKQKVLDRMLGRTRCSECGVELMEYQGIHLDHSYMRGVCVICWIQGFPEKLKTKEGDRRKREE